MLDPVDMVVVLLLAAGAVLAMVRFWLGPTAPDRIVSTDTLSIISTAIIVFLSSLFDSALYLDAALVYAVLAFVGVIALARVIEGGRE